MFILYKKKRRYLFKKIYIFFLLQYNGNYVFGLSKVKLLKCNIELRRGNALSANNLSNACFVFKFCLSFMFELVELLK